MLPTRLGTAHRPAFHQPASFVCAVESREAVLAAVKVRGQARMVHLVTTISGASKRC